MLAPIFHPLLATETTPWPNLFPHSRLLGISGLGCVIKHPLLRPFAGWRAGLRTGRGRRPVRPPGRYGDRPSKNFTLQQV